MFSAHLLHLLLVLYDRPLGLNFIFISLSLQFDLEECLHGLSRLLFPESSCKMLDALFGLRKNVNLVLETRIWALSRVHQKGRNCAAIVDPDAAELNHRVLACIVVLDGCLEVAMSYQELVFVRN
jgi:hypothetical protein